MHFLPGYPSCDERLKIWRVTIDYDYYCNHDYLGNITTDRKANLKPSHTNPSRQRGLIDQKILDETEDGIKNRVQQL